MIVYYFTDGTRSKAFASEKIIDALQFDPGPILRIAALPNNTVFDDGIVEVDNLSYSDEEDVTIALQEFVIKQVRGKKSKVNKHLTTNEYNTLSTFLDEDDNNPSQAVRNINTKLKGVVKYITSLDDREGHAVTYALDVMIGPKDYPIRAAWVSEHMSEAEHKNSNKPAERIKVARELNKAIKKQTGWNV